MEPQALHQILAARAIQEPDRLAYRFVDFERGRESELSYGSLDRRARAVAALLSQHVDPGDRVILIYPSSLDYIAALFGCFYAGAIAVPVYPPVTARMSRTYQLIAEDSKPSVILANTQVMKTLHRVRRIQDLHESRWFRGISGLLFKRFMDIELPDRQVVKWLNTDLADPDELVDARPPEACAEDVALLQYTSGSTGAPKGVVISHGNLMANQRAISELVWGQRDEDLGVGWLPLYHDMGLIGNVLHPVYRGGTFVLFSPLEFVRKPIRWLEAITRYGGTISAGPNFAYELCVNKIADSEIPALDLSRWKIALNGAEPVRRATMRRFVAKFAACGFKEEAFCPCYGLAENTLLAAGRRTGTPLRFASQPEAEERLAPGIQQLVSCGPAVSEQQIAIVDPETGVECAAGEVGEIWLAGPSVAQGYWDQQEATEQAFGARLQGGSEARFLRTGDLGFLDGGELFVSGRIKDLIILNGQNHYPQDIEYSMERSHPALRKGCGVAFSVDTETGEGLVVVQEVKKTKDDFTSVLDAIRSKLHREHALAAREIVLIPPGIIPKTTSGKLRRSACREAYLDDRLVALARTGRGADSRGRGTRRETAARAPGPPAEAVAPPELRYVSQRLRALLARAAELAPDEISEKDRVLDLGFDSLVAADLLDKLEAEFGVSLAHEEVLENPTLGEVAARVLALQHDQRRARKLEPSGGLPLFDAETVLMREIAKGLPVNLVVDSQSRRRVEIGGRSVTDFASLNYLGLDLRKEVVEEIPGALREWGVHPSWTRAVASPRIYEELEETLADHLGVPNVAVFPSISLLNLGVLPLLASNRGALILDDEAHSSLRQACELAHARGARFVQTPHGDLDRLEERLIDHRECNPKLIILDGVYSMSGEYADVASYSELARKHDAFIYLDDAHGFGILGADPDEELPYGYGGCGLVRHCGLDYKQDRILYVAGMSKAFSTYAAFLGCFDEEMKSRIRLAAPYMFSGPVPTASLASGLAGLRVNRAEGDALRKRLFSLTRRLVGGLAAAGVQTDNTNFFPIVFVPVGPVQETLAVWRELWKRGFLITPGVFPAAPVDRGGIRVSITVDNTEAEIDSLIEALRALG